MNEIIRPGAAVLFMKIGTHANEDLASIIARKSKEIVDEGMAMWGYGGSTCHPSTMVQPFAEKFAAQGKPIHLVMESMNSQHFAETAAARQYSIDGLVWQDIPAGINVIGSRYALVIKNLHKDDFLLPLNRTRIPIGRSEGKLGSSYLQGRVDKACLEVMDEAVLINEEVKERPISLVADLHQPYAVFLRGYRD
jgi:hypothetical protein